MQTFSGSEKKPRLQAPPSRPRPEFLTPPKGVRKSRCSQVLTQTIRGTVGESAFMLQYGFAHFITTLKSTLFWFVAISFFIYFNPQNIDWYQRRMAKKKEKEAKKEKE